MVSEQRLDSPKRSVAFSFARLSTRPAVQTWSDQTQLVVSDVKSWDSDGMEGMEGLDGLVYMDGIAMTEGEC